MSQKLKNDMKNWRNAKERNKENGRHVKWS